MNNETYYQYSRCIKKPHQLPPPPKPVPPPKPHKPKPPKKKLNFKTLKKDTCASLNDVECFLNDFSHTWKYIRLLKLLK